MSLLNTVRAKIMKYMGPMHLDGKVHNLELDGGGVITEAVWDGEDILLTVEHDGKRYTFRVKTDHERAAPEPEVFVKSDDPLAGEV